MAFLGDFGKLVGFGTTKQTLGGAVRGAIQGALTGNPIGGAAVGLASSGGTQNGQAIATTVSSSRPQETSTSGSTDNQNLIAAATPTPNPLLMNASYGMNVPSAGRGNIQQANLPAIIGGGTAAARGIGGMLGLAGGAIMAAPTIIDMVTGEEKKLRVTRRLRSQVKQAVMMFGVEVVAENMGTTPEVIFYILTKKMRNDGAYVTKAAVRKTRQTVRKMKNLCDMYDDLRPPARRAPARRTASKTTLIKN